VADLFAGSGASGSEASSRGAEKAIFVEQAPPAIRAIRANIAALHAQPKCDVRAASVSTSGPVKDPVDSVSLDPPYGTGAGAVAIDRSVRLGWIGEGTWISSETAANEQPQIRACEVDAERKVGKASLTLSRLKS
ncbi:hypothetical protein OY671_010278, partial [Metschnikowia pulcherrima]